MPSSPRTWSSWLAVWVVVTIAVTVLWTRPPQGPGDEIASALRTYASLLQASEDSQAWRAHTTHAYRRRTPEVVFLAAQARNRDELGPLQALRISPDAPHHTFDEDGTEVVRVIVGWQGEVQTIRTAFDLTLEQNTWRIHRTWAWPNDNQGYARTW